MVTSRPVRHVDTRVKVLPEALSDHSVSTPTVTSSSVDKSVSGQSGDACAPQDVGNGHVTNTASNFRLSSSTTRGEDGERKEDTKHYQHRQQENHDGKQDNSEFPNCLKTATSVIPKPGDSIDQGIRQHHYHHLQHQQKQQLQQDVQQNLLPSNCSRVVSSTEKIQNTNNRLHSAQHQRHQQLQQERQWNATSKNWNSSMTMALNDLTGDMLPRSRGQGTRRTPLSPPPISWHQTQAATSIVRRTPTAGDGLPAVPTDGGMTRPGKTAQDSSVISTLPRAKFETTKATNGDASQRQTVLSSQANSAVRPLQVPFYPPDNGRSSWRGGHNPVTPSLKSKEVTFSRDRVHFFTPNELAAAVASGSAHTTPSKTSWFRRKLFK